MINNSKNEHEILYVDVIISAIGICPNTENLGIKQNNTKHICVDKYYSTNVKGYYAIGDVAHVAYSEGIICVEKITGYPLNYNNVYRKFHMLALKKGFKLKIGIRQS